MSDRNLIDGGIRVFLDLLDNHKSLNCEVLDMSYDLPLSEDFFTGAEETQETNRPASILEAIENLSAEEKLSIAKHVMQSSAPEIYVTTESFAYDVLDKVRETNTCSNLNSPVRVWIDAEGYYTLDVYDGEQ